MQEGLLGGKDSQAGRTPRREGLLLLGGKELQAGWTPRWERLQAGWTPRREILLDGEDSYSWWELRGCV